MTDFPKYPKIHTLFVRDEEDHKVVRGQFKRPEFAVVGRWDVTEKVDGTNIRIHMPMNSDVPDGDAPRVLFGGRTDRAQVQTALLERLQATFTHHKMLNAFPNLMDTDVTLFGEGYGAKIQKGGGRYRPDPSFRLFDVLLSCSEHPRGLWLRRDAVEDVAKKLEIFPVPQLACQLTTPEIVDLVSAGFQSQVALEDSGDPGALAEGIVARAPHGLLDRMGRRVIWKLKARDF